MELGFFVTHQVVLLMLNSIRAPNANNNNNNTNNNNNNNQVMFMVLSSWLRVIARVHPVQAMNAEQRQKPADLWTKPSDLSHRPACKQLGNHIHHCHLL